MATRTVNPSAAAAAPTVSAGGATEKELAGEFSISDPDLLSRCLKICSMYRLSASDLGTEWGLLLVQRKVKHMTAESLGVLERSVRDGFLNKQAKSAKQQQFTQRTKTSATFNAESAAALLNNVLGGGTPVRGGRPPETTTPLTAQQGTPPSGGGSGAFAKRQDAGKVLCSLNPDLGFAGSLSQLELVPEQTGGPLLVKTSMYVKLEQRASEMDEQLSAFEDEVAARGDLPMMASLLDTSAEEVTVVGRVCCEGEGKLNAQSVFLEGAE